jgi:hypothetical protein
MVEHTIELPDGRQVTVTGDHWMPPPTVTVDGMRYFRPPALTVAEAQRVPTRYLLLWPERQVDDAEDSH